jgi:hypothetical protein
MTAVPSQDAARRVVDDLNEKYETADWRRFAGHAVHNDPAFGVANAHFIVVGADTEAYYSAAVAYLTTMAENGNHVAAMVAACRIIDIPAPAEDRGPFDQLMDKHRERRAERRRDNSTTPPATRRARLMAFLTKEC